MLIRSLRKDQHAVGTNGQRGVAGEAVVLARFSDHVGAWMTCEVVAPPRAAPAAPAARHPTPARRASRRRPAACADCARLARLGEPPVAPAGVPGEKWLYISYTRRGSGGG